MLPHPQLLNILREHKPVSYHNGHDHSLSLGVDVIGGTKRHKTLYLSSGAGSLPDSPCTVAVYRNNLLYSFADSVKYLNASVACPGGFGPNQNNALPPVLGGQVGFAIVTATAKSFQVREGAEDGDSTKVFSCGFFFHPHCHM